MSFFDLFKKKKIEPEKQKQSGQGVSANLYPDRIIIYTDDQTIVGYWLSTEKISFLPNDTTDEMLGRTILHHLTLSRNNQPIPENFSKFGKSRLKAMGFKTAKAEYLNAKHLSILKKDDKITIFPSVNGGPTGKSRGFSYFGESILVQAGAGDEELGQQIKRCWTLCK